jgi:hypothetical protein
MSDVYGAALAKRIIAAYGEEIDLWSVRSADLHPLDLAMVKWIILKHWRAGTRLPDDPALPQLAGIALRANQWIPEDMIALRDACGRVIGVTRLTPHAR